MLAYPEALAAAHQHLWSRRAPPEWVWRLPVGVRVAGGWYFACSLEPLRLIDDGLGVRFGGPLGCFVADDGTARRTGRPPPQVAEPGAAADTGGRCGS